MSLIEKRLRRLQQTIAYILLAFPGLLMLFALEDRSSISDFVYATNNAPFFTLILGASLLFIFNGSVFRDDHEYNIYLGISLMLVAWFRHIEFPIIHFTSAAIFYIGSCYVMVVYSSTKQRLFKIFMVVFTFIGLLLHFVFDLYSLFVAEWIGLLPICTHFILESKKKFN